LNIEKFNQQEKVNKIMLTSKIDLFKLKLLEIFIEEETSKDLIINIEIVEFNDLYEKKEEILVKYSTLENNYLSRDFFFNESLNDIKNQINDTTQQLLRILKYINKGF